MAYQVGTGQAAQQADNVPFAPHTIADVDWSGGGPVPLPGKVSLAHHGVLLLDELSEVRHHVLEGLRQLLEEGVI
jgi:magnesium chelatase family protein